MASPHLVHLALATAVAGGVTLGVPGGAASAAVPATRVAASSSSSSVASMSVQQWRTINITRVYAAINADRRRHHLKPITGSAFTRTHVTRAQRHVQAVLNRGASFMSVHRRWTSLAGDCGGGASNRGFTAFGAATLIAHMKKTGEWAGLTRKSVNHFSMAYASHGWNSVVIYDFD